MNRRLWIIWEMLITDYAVAYLTNPMESVHKLQKLLSEFSKVTG